MAKQSLNCLNVFSLVDKKCREAVAEVVEAESLTSFQPDSGLNRGWAISVTPSLASLQKTAKRISR